MKLSLKEKLINKCSSYKPTYQPYKITLTHQWSHTELQSLYIFNISDVSIEDFILSALISSEDTGCLEISEDVIEDVLSFDIKESDFDYFKKITGIGFKSAFKYIYDSLDFVENSKIIIDDWNQIVFYFECRGNRFLWHYILPE